ncbi:MAG: SDR family oxidoreductase [Alphaproteobacteria bacterium]|nr:SDR family oxidoreductase [Alphaproteobacteria bacterium]
MFLVTGASGHLGQAVINHLITTYKIPATSIIATTRDPGKLAALAAKGINIRDANFDDEAHLIKAFAGASRLLLISTNAMEPGVRLKQHQNAVKAAEKAGVGHVVYTSMPNPETSAVLFAPDHVGTEKALASSGIKGWTVLRNNWYFENLFFSLPQALAAGTQYSAAGQGKIAQIARDDLARAAAAALVSDFAGKQTLTLSGAKEYTTDQIAALVSKAVGKPLTVVHVPVEGLLQGMLGAGLPEALARMFASFDVNTAQGGLSGSPAAFKTLTGVEPQSFEAWLSKNAGAFTASGAH